MSEAELNGTSARCYACWLLHQKLCVLLLISAQALLAASARAGWRSAPEGGTPCWHLGCTWCTGAALPMPSLLASRVPVQCGVHRPVPLHDRLFRQDQLRLHHAARCGALALRAPGLDRWWLPWAVWLPPAHRLAWLCGTSSLPWLGRSTTHLASLPLPPAAAVLLRFCILLLGSLLIGVGVALACAFVLKLLRGTDNSGGSKQDGRQGMQGACRAMGRAPA